MHREPGHNAALLLRHDTEGQGHGGGHEPEEKGPDLERQENARGNPRGVTADGSVPERIGRRRLRRKPRPSRAHTSRLRPPRNGRRTPAPPLCPQKTASGPFRSRNLFLMRQPCAHPLSLMSAVSHKLPRRLRQTSPKWLTLPQDHGAE